MKPQLILTAAVVVASSLAVAPNPTSAASSITAVQTPTGTYRIRSAEPGYTDRCLQRHTQASLDSGPLVGLEWCNTSAYQLWDLTPAPRTPSANVVRNRAGGCLDADNRGGRPTWVVHVIPCSGSPSDPNPYQEWIFNAAPALRDRVCASAFCGVGNTLFLDRSTEVYSGIGYRVNLWYPTAPTAPEAQRFRLERVG